MTKEINSSLSAVKNNLLLSRRKAITRWGFGGVAGLLGSLTGYGTLFEPHHPVLESLSIPIRGLPSEFEGIRLVQISDLHIQPGFPGSALKPAIRLVQRARPDLILITGDYINDDVGDPTRYMSECIGALSALRAPLGVYASFGNHDFPDSGDPSREPWTAAGITPLLDDVATIRRGARAIYLIGLRSFIKRPVTPADSLRLTPRDSIRIVLWHEPDRAVECAQEGAALQLSGHTHGGQVVIPFFGPPILPAGGRIYPSGLFSVEGMPLYVTRGIGLLSPRIRLNCPPEVTQISLHRA